MSIAGIGSHTDYYYGIAMQRQVTGKDENFGTYLQEEGTETIPGELGSCSSINRQQLYEAMSNSFQFAELNTVQQVGESTGAVMIAEREDFWKDFLDGNIDVSSYEEYIVRTSGQVPKGMVIEKSIVSLPSGVSFYMSKDNGEVACIDDSSKLPGRQCLWSKILSEEDFVKCKELFDRQKGEATWEYKYGAYLSHESFWEMYLNDGLDLAKLEEVDNLFKEEGVLDRLLAKCPDSVKNAWELAMDDVEDLFSLNAIGNVNYYSELYNQVLFSMVQGNDFAVLGTTEEEALSFAQNAIDSLNNITGYNDEALHIREREKRFYEGFINNLMNSKILQ